MNFKQLIINQKYFIIKITNFNFSFYLIIYSFLILIIFNNHYNLKNKYNFKNKINYNLNFTYKYLKMS